MSESGKDWSIEPYRFPDPAAPVRGEPGRPVPPPPPPPVFGKADAYTPRPRQPKPKKRKQPPVLLIGLVAFLVLIGAGLGGGAWWVLHDLPQIPDEKTLWAIQRAPGMTFEDANGDVIATRGAKNGYRVRLADLPAYVPKAFLAAEDRRFYDHGAVDYKGMARAFLANLRAGGVVQGGSTISQQIAKTLFLSPDRTLKRKIQEALIATELEKRMSKDEVLELYLNRIFFGNKAYGLDSASEIYFGKRAGALSVSEAALLASLPQAPTKLALNKNMRAALARSRLVLAAMREEGWINEAQETLAIVSPPSLAPPAPSEGDIGYVLDYAAAEATRLLGEAAPDLVIRLTIDMRLQAIAQQTVREVIRTDGRKAGASQAAFVAMTPDGAIRALVGGLDHRVSPFNRATQAKRQPGSSFKPFVYAAALENGVQPFDVRQDAPVRYGTWQPTNYGGGYRGAVSIETALSQSINTVAVRLASEVGGARIGEIARRFGLSAIPPRPDLSVALGAYEVNLLDLTSAFQVFQNQGQRRPAFLIAQIASSRGDALYTPPQSGQTVYSKDNAGVMVRMMMSVVERGTGVRAGFGRPAAGKTGTSQNWRDAWFVGFTPDWAGGAWVGNDDDTPMNRVTGGVLPAQIWRRFMIAAHQGAPVHGFDWAPPLVPPPSEEEPEVEEVTPAQQQAAAVSADRRGFYDGLAADFADAGQP